MSELTTVYLCRVDLNNRYEHSIHFNFPADQRTFFANHVTRTTTNYTFIRRSWDLQVNIPYEQIRDVNYLYFNQSGKTWYYFINSFEYKNEGSTTLNLELDVIQTYMFDWSLPPCFIERQHTSSDELYEHTLDEGLECGELIDRIEKKFTAMSDMCCLVYATINPILTTEDNGIVVYILSNLDNVFSGVCVYAVEPKDFGRLAGKLQEFSTMGCVDGIVAMHMYPKALVRIGTGFEWGDDNIFKLVIGSHYFEESFQREPYLRTYIPMNKKLYCYPYNMVVASNNNGGSAVYKFERFGSVRDYDYIDFKVVGGIAPDSGCKLIPYAYNNKQNQYNDEEGLNINGYPSCMWNSDTYKVWLAQNQNQHAWMMKDANVKAVSAVAGGLIGAIGSAAVGNVAGVAGSVAGGAMGGYNAYSQIQALTAQKNDMALTPPQARGNLSPSLAIANELLDFTLIYKTITDENAKIIDDYFNMYGYKLNRVMRPNICTRMFYTYIKTVGCIVHGNFNNLDKLKIASIFDNGITFWTNGDHIGEYCRDNDCVIDV